MPAANFYDLNPGQLNSRHAKLGRQERIQIILIRSNLFAPTPPLATA